MPKGSALEKEISKAKIGIVWHTTYSGASFESMSASYGEKITSKLKKSKDVWMQDATLPDISGSATMTADETSTLTMHLSNAGKLFKKIQAKTLKEIEDNKELNLVINTYNNAKVRAGEKITNTKSHANGLIDFVNNRYAKQASKLKTKAGKDSVDAKKQDLLKFFSKSNLKNLQNVFDLQNYVVDAKLIIINKLNSLNSIGTFVKTKSGFKVTSPEGFVAIDRTAGGAVKLVDRLEFSTKNFSTDIIKGWDNPG